MYDPNLSKLLAQMSELTYVQYNNGVPPANNGAVTLPAGFTQTASFTAPEIDINKLWPHYTNVDWQNITGRQEVAAMNLQLQEVYFGFAATSAQYNIIALRGTQSAFEWLLDANIPQVPVPLVWYNNGKFQLAKVHLGFAIFYTLLIEQILDAFNKFNNSLPCLVTGHSLGAALATMVAPSLKIANIGCNVEMYNYASPRVGNVAFAGAYSALVSDSYRIVNLGDLIPMLPPTNVIGLTYADVPTEWSFLNQTGNIAGNHALIGTDNYTDAVNAAVPTNAPRTYPVTGL
ncbi:lipase family protein [Ferruginibacter sp. SUN106]|uniref:lipase family protein n=1 Tax=Ferruginibacter sp. SUN106 TaxID=2978348 RepID=UPI003D35A109